jgi:hypothetical protein
MRGDGMKEKVVAKLLVERTRAEVQFADGRTETFTSSWGDSQQGRGYDGNDPLFQGVAHDGNSRAGIRGHGVL